MTQYFVINDKEYIVSAEVARRFGYTPDYVSRLAREGKITASKVNRKWFIDVDSFVEFQQSTNVEKEQRAKKLKVIRQQERQFYLKHTASKKKQEKEHVYIAMAQSFAMFVCFAFVGLLSWTVVDSDMTISDVSFGLSQTSKQLAQVMLTGASAINDVSLWSTALVIQSKKSQVIQTYRNDAGTLVPHSFTAPLHTPNQNMEKDTLLLFSDEVELLSQVGDIRIIRPVFTNNRFGQSYKVIPIE